MIPLTLLAVLAFQSASQDPKDPSTRAYFEYRNAEDGVTFKVDNGRVALTVPDDQKKGATKQYQAATLQEFRRLYPELVKKYDLDQYVPRAMKPEAVEQWWKEFAARSGLDEEQRMKRFLEEFPKESTDARRALDRWFQEEHQQLRNLERRFHAEGMPLAQSSEENRGAVLGVLVAPVTDPLRSQLKLQPQEGLLVAEVENNRLAERSGLREHDILLKISGQGISGDAAKFREQVMTALHAKEFTLDLIRGGERQTLTVHPGVQPKG
ncbi:MAG TPA: PDZ domain-containing protein [Planctomycetota bacterium]|jgi:hypothetical protein|nr:PDZ domain-containing protein [Planctomycetota bacterium]